MYQTNVSVSKHLQTYEKDTTW